MREKDRMRGFGTASFCSEVRPPSPQPSPLRGEGGVPCASFCGLSWQAFPFSRRVSAPKFFLRAIENGARASKIRSREARNRSGPRKGQGWGLPFRSSVTSVSPDQAFKKQINEGSGTPANAGSPTAASCDAARAHSERARLPAFHRGSHLRELFHPKGSASGQASWDAV
jgi:hypothetical protein